MAAGHCPGLPKAMQTYTISKLARQFGLSRSTLLYYDRIGLLPAAGRSASGYRVYTEGDRSRLERICHLREASLALEDIRTILASAEEPGAALMEKRLQEVGAEIRVLQAKQRLLARMLRGISAREEHPRVNKELWVAMLRAAGLDESGMERWHAEFEQRAPEAHQEFLLSLGITETEVQRIRQWSKQMQGPDPGEASPGRDGAPARAP